MDQERKIKLEQLRGTIHIDIPATAVVAGVSPSIVYQMITRYPVKREEAERVLRALSTHERLLSLETVDIVLWEDFLVLHCARATDDVHLENDVLHFVYARDAEDARRQLYTWIERIHRPHVYFTPIPDGLIIGAVKIPGTQCIMPDDKSKGEANE